MSRPDPEHLVSSSYPDTERERDRLAEEIDLEAARHRKNSHRFRPDKRGEEVSRFHSKKDRSFPPIFSIEKRSSARVSIPRSFKTLESRIER